MYSEIKIYNPGEGKRGHVEVYIDGVRKHLVSGEELGVCCFPNSSKLTEVQRAKEFHQLAYLLEANLKKGWRPKDVIVKRCEGLVIPIIEGVINSFRTSYKARYADDVIKYATKFIAFLKSEGLASLSTAQLEPMHIEPFLQAYQTSKKALQYLYAATRQLKQYSNGKKTIPKNFKIINVYILEDLGESYLFLHQKDSAVFYFNKGINYAREFNFADLDNIFDNDLANVAALNGDKQTALKYFRKAEALNREARDISSLDYNYSSMSEMYKRFKQPDSAIFYAQKALRGAREGKFLLDVLFASKQLYKIYDQQHDIPRAYQYYKMATQVNDSINSQENIRELVSMDFTEKQRQQEIAAQQQAYQSTLRTYLLSAVIIFFLVLAIIFWRNNRQKQKANYLLSEQKEEISAQRDNLEQTLGELKNTQTQLIQSEKMASLGELTAGIAHEIQNPLNFVNNFSDVNREMIDELKGELKAGNVEEALVIAEDIQQNEVKINHHGKRADSIVKGMLEHSRNASGQKEPTDINQLADEYLRLSYHGLRAKDKSFNSELVTNFDPTLPKVNAIPQDIGRVLLNLFNNAFYALNQKVKTAGSGYKPTVKVSTLSENGHVIIKVKDNGVGMPEHIKEKIMQPFFTTKPTGEGTGLGLSLTYDMVVKGHGGSIVVTSKDGEGSEFTIQLPIN